VKFEKLWYLMANVSIVLCLATLCRLAVRSWHALPYSSHIGLVFLVISSILLWLSMLREKSSALSLLFVAMTMFWAVETIFPYPG
jgi:hypothetical protein